MSFTRRSSGAGRPYQGRTSSQHWYRDNQVYFLTARCRAKYPALEPDEVKACFWQTFDDCCEQFGFTPWVTSLLNNHYHTIGYLRHGTELSPMMRMLHGRLARYANQVLESQFKAGGLQVPLPQPPLNACGRLLPFWGDSKRKSYFDGCLRDEKQGRLTYRYVLTQCKRHRICEDWRDHPHTHVNIEMDRAIRRATEVRAFLYGVKYKRYMT